MYFFRLGDSGVWMIMFVVSERLIADGGEQA
jgi:hypothetical protein